MKSTVQPVDAVFNLIHDSMNHIKKEQDKNVRIDLGELSPEQELYSSQEMWFCCSVVSILSATLGIIIGVVHCFFM